MSGETTLIDVAKRNKTINKYRDGYYDYKTTITTRAEIEAIWQSCETIGQDKPLSYEHSFDRKNATAYSYEFASRVQFVKQFFDYNSELQSLSSEQMKLINSFAEAVNPKDYYGRANIHAISSILKNCNGSELFFSVGEVVKDTQDTTALCYDFEASWGFAVASMHASDNVNNITINVYGSISEDTMLSMDFQKVSYFYDKASFGENSDVSLTIEPHAADTAHLAVLKDNYIRPVYNIATFHEAIYGKSKSLALGLNLASLRIMSPKLQPQQEKLSYQLDFDSQLTVSTEGYLFTSKEIHSKNTYAVKVNVTNLAFRQ